MNFLLIRCAGAVLLGGCVYGLLTLLLGRSSSPSFLWDPLSPQQTSGSRSVHSFSGITGTLTENIWSGAAAKRHRPPSLPFSPQSWRRTIRSRASPQ